MLLARLLKELVKTCACHTVAAHLLGAHFAVEALKQLLHLPVLIEHTVYVLNFKSAAGGNALLREGLMISGFLRS